jgi:hypothetical protein
MAPSNPTSLLWNSELETYSEHKLVVELDLD